MNNIQYNNLIALIDFYLEMSKSGDDFTRALATRELRKLRGELVQVIEITKENTEKLRYIA